MRIFDSSKRKTKEQSVSKQFSPKTISSEKTNMAVVNHQTAKPQQAQHMTTAPKENHDKQPELSKEQLNFYDQINSRSDNFFITGKAGTGKSVLLRHFVKNTHKRVAVVAPTGIAAINVEGQTIHSFFGLDTSVQNPKDRESVYKGLSDKRTSLLNNLDCIVIDEVSMVRVDIMDMIDAKLRAARRNHVPFGGCQVICFGDLFQLPPVSEKDKKAQKYLDQTYHTIYFFGAPCFIANPPIKLELTQVFRQTDRQYIDTLNSIRTGFIQDAQLNYINRRASAKQPKQTLILTPTNAAANKINNDRLMSLPLPEYVYQGEIKGVFTEKEYPTDLMLKLRRGAQVMLLKNHPEKKWVNGTIALISKLSETTIHVTINGVEYSVDKETWTKYEYDYDEHEHKLVKKEIGSFRQFPLRLAYAITIHKSQGQTYDSVVIDYSQGNAFAAGQTYVALSRCRTYDNLFLTKEITSQDIKVSQEILSFMSGDLHLPPVKYQPQTWEPSDETKINSNNTISVDPDTTHKKLTGTRLPRILGLDRFNSPFQTWCEIMRVYEDPFVDNKFTIAGKIIEPKQLKYVKTVLAQPKRKFVTPEDVFGQQPKESTGYDFFSSEEVFGGMWDYLIKDSNTITGVLEMKTKQSKNRRFMEQQYPKDLIMQAGLYAYLLGVKDIYMITSYIDADQYDDPNRYTCTSSNTTIDHYDLESYFKGFKESCIDPAVQWWKKHIETGISPVPSTSKDFEILNEIKRHHIHD